MHYHYLLFSIGIATTSHSATGSATQFKFPPNPLPHLPETPTLPLNCFRTPTQNLIGRVIPRTRRTWRCAVSAVNIMQLTPDNFTHGVAAGISNQSSPAITNGRRKNGHKAINNFNESWASATCAISNARLVQRQTHQNLLK
jgi:hypothetical protein